MKATQPVRVLIADDSALAREFLCDLFDDIEEIKIIGKAENGKQAVEFCRIERPDLILMDVEMPVMDGIEATKTIMSTTPIPIVIFSSISRSTRSFKAIPAGAVEVMEKPRMQEIETWKQDVRKLVRKIQMFSRIKVVRHLRPKLQPPTGLEDASVFVPRLVVVGSSTGGPQALQTLFSGLPSNLPFPIVVVQHMTKGFLQGMVSWIESSCAVRATIAKDGQMLQPGCIFFAPEDIYCALKPPGMISLTHDLPKWTEHKPCVNYLFQTAAKMYPEKTLALLLTGMGKDGAQGMLELRNAGGRTITQDRGSCMIYGMPREAVEMGASQKSMGLEEMNAMLKSFSGGQE